jgi:8-oxo-dGTP pyrophosphatase MutT (NUDIX family)
MAIGHTGASQHPHEGCVAHIDTSGPQIFDVRPREQVAALPWRKAHDALQVLLVTSRGTGRWILPKGWMDGDEDPAAAAAREAFEEAGVSGTIVTSGLGFYTYDKRLDGGPSIKCRVRVYALKVERQEKTFKEAGERLLQWFPALEAADAVKETELAGLIRQFAENPKA